MSCLNKCFYCSSWLYLSCSRCSTRSTCLNFEHQKGRLLQSAQGLFSWSSCLAWLFLRRSGAGLGTRGLIDFYVNPKQWYTVIQLYSIYTYIFLFGCRVMVPVFLGLDKMPATAQFILQLNQCYLDCCLPIKKGHQRNQSSIDGRIIEWINHNM